MSEFDVLMESMERTAYNKWMRTEGIPVVNGYGIEDVRDLELASWEAYRWKGSLYQPLRNGRGNGNVCSPNSPGRCPEVRKASL